MNMFVRVSLVLALAAVSSLAAPSDGIRPDTRIYQITCQNYECNAGLKVCVESKCYGPQCPACMAINFKVCSKCMEALEDSVNFIDIAGMPYLICDPAFEVQRTACDFTCRGRFKASGECIKIGGYPVCNCIAPNITNPGAPAGIVPVEVSTTTLQPPITKPPNPDFGKVEAKFSSHTGTVWALNVLPNGMLISGASDKSIKVWDPVAATLVKSLTDHTGSVYSLAVLPDGRFASGSADNSIIIWSQSFTPVTTLYGHSGSVKALAVMPNGDLVSASSDKSIRVWNTTNYATKRVLKGHTLTINSLAVTKNGALTSASDDGTICVWSESEDTPTKQIKSDRGAVFSMTALRGDLIAAGYARNSEIRIYNVAIAEAGAVAAGHEMPALSFAVLPNGDFASGSGDQLIYIHDRDTFGIKHVLKGSIDNINALTVLPDGRLVSAANRVISIWNVNEF